MAFNLKCNHTPPICIITYSKHISYAHRHSSASFWVEKCIATRVCKSECMVEAGMSWYSRFDSVEMWRPWISPEIVLRKVEQPEPGQTKTRHISSLLTNPSKSINIRIFNFPLPLEHYPDNRQSSGTLPTVFWWSVEEPNPWRMEKDTPLTSEFVDDACRLLMGWQSRFLWIARSKVV